MQAAVFRMSARGRDLRWGKGLNAVGAFTDLEIGWQREMSAKSCSTPLYIRRSIQFKS
ncbi:hypothetical protein ACMXZI_00885 [Bacillus subtilis]|uniref:Uncharacterized protein n=2 Tax=Bacillus subtilis TaxID=1423 RepID=A0AAP1E915_BACIU|nr:hypothetical protein [Bacillus subtilis]KAF2427872.1 hypothetical protein B6K89_02025 [Bacillus subtilis]KIN50988.1 hypothetical protein B4146_0443 [Bacillus subtilis]KZD94312.1 hypothetical protein B4122_1008 [Bacillus subtilis]